MQCISCKDRLVVETDNCIYEVEFGQIQIEITGRCNMDCEHCRAHHEAKQDLPIEQIEKIVRFARRFSPDYKEIVISGGEPFLYRRFCEVITLIRGIGGKFVTVTTNGSLVKNEYLDLIESLNFDRFIISISLDSLDPSEHDIFRHYKGAFEKAVKAIKLCASRKNVFTSVRVTLRPHQLCDMEKIVGFIHAFGCKRVSLSSVIPSGRAMHRPDLLLSRAQRQFYHEEVRRLKELYKDAGLDVTTNDPLKCLVRPSTDLPEDDDHIVFDGCPAAALTFNVGANGIMTPCSLLNIPIMDVNALTIDEMIAVYQQSDIVKNMLDMNLKGKCGRCDRKYQCGGCRARALAINGDYLAEDPDCWL